MIFSGKNILIAYSVIAVLLFLYSFTQVDLGLTLTQASWWQVLQTSFQYVGYFNRPLSAALYTALVLFMFILYGLLLWLAHQKKLEKKHVWISLLVTGGVLLFSYSAFSYDIFNYIFDAKIVTYYNLNPYVYKALDFPNDPMLSFMHWTHRVYPYGPIWLAVTVPLSFLGFTFFLPTYFLFKALGVASYLGSVYYISKISKKIFPQSEISNMAFFAFNPLVIIESLVSAHNDIFMLFLALWSFSMLLEKKKMFAFVLILFSIGIKFATLFLFPVLLIISFWQKKGKNISW
ncbi:MAG: glycosyltransferase 87 family protein, partial [Patescibacteria group bacterium]